MLDTNQFSPLAAFWACCSTFILIVAIDAMFAAQITTIA